MDEIGSSFICYFQPNDHRRNLLDGDELLEKTHQELVNLQYTSVTPETIEDYYRATTKGCSQGWLFCHHIGAHD